MNPEDYDRTTESDGQVFYGYDDEEDGTTTWYTEDMVLECTTDTPDEDDWNYRGEQDMYDYEEDE